MVLFAEINPSIWFLIVWGIISWLSSQSKKKRKQNENNSVDEPKPSDLRERLQQLKDHMASELDIFPTNEVVEIEENPIFEDNLELFKEVELKEDCKFTEEKSKIIPTKSSINKNHIFKDTNLKRAILLKEILDKPRALKPITDDW